MKVSDPDTRTLLEELRTQFRQGLPPSQCPSRELLNHVTGKWSVLVLVALADRTLRWSELRRTVEGVSEKMLAQTLHTLEADGLVLRHAFAVVPPHVEYRLSELGVELVQHLVPLVAWSVRHAADTEPASQ